MEAQNKKVKSNKNSKQGIQTLFRVTARTQLSLINIADNKANMIMGINAMIITVLIGIISRDLLFLGNDYNPDWHLIIPMVSIILTALFTTIFAIRAVKPRLLNLMKPKTDTEIKPGLLFFEDIWQMSTAEYIEKMDTMIQSPADIYHNLIIDIHSQAKVLHKKYELLRYAYTVFMIGLIISISIFLVMLLFTY